MRQGRKVPPRITTVTVPDMPGAECAGHPQPWLWDRQVPGEGPEQYRARRTLAASVCARCPELARCPDAIRRGVKRRTVTAQRRRRCAECQELFAPTQGHQLFCVTACRDAQHNRRRRVTKQLRRRETGTPPPAEMCRLCPTPLTYEQRQRRRVYCGTTCAREAHRRREAARRGRVAGSAVA